MSSKTTAEPVVPRLKDELKDHASFHLKKLGPDRYLVWDLLRETDPYYLNQHFFDTDMSVIEADLDLRQQSGKPFVSYLAYALAAYSRTLMKYPELNSYLRLYPFTRLAVYDGVDIAVTVEREWQGSRIVLLCVLRDAQKLTVNAINNFLSEKRDKPLEELEEFSRYRNLLKVPAFCRWPLFQLLIKPFPSLMRQMFGTTAFTSVGKYGSTITAPLSPRSCTLSVGHVEKRPRVKGSEVRPALSGWLTLTYDHRICDGALVAKMGNDLRHCLETWQEPHD